MKFTRELAATLTVRGVSGDGIRIGNDNYAQTVALSPERVITDWPEKPLADLTIDDFDSLLADNTELIVIGTGANTAIPSRELMFAFARRGVGLEMMDTAAAARTFNVLAGEGRRVIAVLYLV